MIEPRAHEAAHEEQTVCSKCGMVLKSSYEWITVENERILCVFCYKDYMFPHLDENYMEIFD